MPRRGVFVACCAFAAAAGGYTERHAEEPIRRPAAIVRGTPAPSGGEPGVVAVAVQHTGNFVGFGTGAGIGSDTLRILAHCVDVYRTTLTHYGALPDTERRPAGSSYNASGAGPGWLLVALMLAWAARGRPRSWRRRSPLAAATVAALLACGSREAAVVEARRASEIVGGTTDLGDLEVFMLEVEFTTQQLTVCSATLIGERTLVTAAHCVDPRVAGASGVSIRATNRPNADSAVNSDWIPIVAARLHPGWDPRLSLDDDIALALLESVPATPKKPWNRATLSTYAGKAVRAVGYGITAKSASDWGLKRQVSLVINSVDVDHLYLGDGVDSGICHGDSGGPTFHVFPDGVERLVGIHSYDANQQCTSGADGRIDAYADFIDDWVMENETPRCDADGLCRKGCTPVDPDCSPPDCASNGICAVDECPAPDVDCVEMGQPCSSALQCQSRECVADPQHSGTYCSRPCNPSSGCPPAMECAANASVCVFAQLPIAAPGASCAPGATFCSGGTVCAGTSPATTWCSKPCGLDSDCGASAACASGLGGVRYCKPLPALTPPKMPVAPEPTGCAATGGGPLVLLPLISWAMRSRRAGFRRAA
jgi:V8-like Glu-specific endopeptidase